MTAKRRPSSDTPLALRAELVKLKTTLEQALAEAPASARASLARELRATLSDIAAIDQAAPKAKGTPLDELEQRRRTPAKRAAPRTPRAARKP